VLFLIYRLGDEMIWKDPYLKVRQSHILTLAIRNNFKMLSSFGEPVYLLIRTWRKDAHADGQTVVSFTGADIQLKEDYGFFDLWVDGSSNPYPDFRTVEVYKDGVLMSNVLDEFFIKQDNHYSVKVLRGVKDESSPLIVRIFFHSSLVNSAFNFEARYFEIDRSFDEIGRAEAISNSESPLAFYGWSQFRWNGVLWKGNLIPDAFLIIMPDLERDLINERTGITVTSTYRAWTNTFPFAPMLKERDIIVRLNGLRYEIRNMTLNKIADFVVQQEFDIGEIDPSNPVYNIPVDTINGVLQGYPEDIVWSGI